MGNRRNRALITGHKNKILALSQTVATARIAPKVCQGQPRTFGSKFSKFYPNRFIFGRVIAKRVKDVLFAHRVNPWFALNTLEAINDNETTKSSETLIQ